MKFRNDFERQCWISVVQRGEEWADAAVKQFRRRNDRIGFLAAQATLMEASCLARDQERGTLATNLEAIIELLEVTEK